MKYSIIIPVYNGIEYTLQCISSVQKHSTDYEIIIVDGNSSDETVKLADSPDLTYIRLSENRGFSYSVNQGIKTAHGNFIVLLNNDTLVCNEWLQKFENAHNENGPYCIVGPVSNSAGKYQTKYPDITEQDFYEITEAEIPVKLSEPPSLSGFCLFFPAYAIQHIGFFDEQFLIGNFEDTDFCMRAKSAGYHIICAEHILVYHFGGKTFSKNHCDYNLMYQANSLIFTKKWASFFPVDVSSYIRFVKPGDTTLILGKNAEIPAHTLNKPDLELTVSDTDIWAKPACFYRTITMDIHDTVALLKSEKMQYNSIILTSPLSFFPDILPALSSLLKYGSSMYFYIPNFSHYSILMNLMWDSTESLPYSISDHNNHFLTASELNRFIETASLQTVRTEFQLTTIPDALQSQLARFSSQHFCSELYIQKAAVSYYMYEIRLRR